MLYEPPKDSSKGENGKLLFIGGSKSYSGAAILALKTAIHFSDIVLFYPAEYDDFLISSVKASVPEVIVVYDLKRAISSVDSILFGSGMGRAFFDFSLLKSSGKKIVVDGDGIKHIKAPLSRRFLLTPNKKEMSYLLSSYSSHSIIELASSLNAYVLQKGYVNKLSDGIKVQEITGGNPGLTKAGTGDVLAGLIASLATKNSLWDSAVYGLRALLSASSSLFKQKSYYYSASDLIDLLGFSLASLK